ncbi:phosphate ABC transporter substrate-binding protein (PhoT family) [Flavobacterium croceum DSM 17960]|uniref:Phosphate ABC transporter substrate-binding protein (PhoT family) n=1 Tax=Flavobacterium croceum DSM 17960 TaxID=1121886 RepID=A0A2S4NA14_9FLAO|nr:substrate-binding domain-containing protein [Flavobacterium croceum]POS02527.1 phosphate ABC transporter substrate-binding protein (PhoT family) [Flavobacterium croceum DSM 17960]
MMNKNSWFKVLSALIVLVSITWSCNNTNKKQQSDTILTGKLSIAVDESLQPIVEDQQAVFENTYNAKLQLLPLSENEILQSLVDKKANTAVMARALTAQERKYFQSKTIYPQQTPIAIDAVTLIRNKKEKDTLIALEDLKLFFEGDRTKVKGLVFDNLNSSTVSFLLKKFNLQKLPEKDIYSFKNNNEVIKYVSENSNMIGIIGLNWLVQPSSEVEQYIDKISVLSVKDFRKTQYIYPSQENLVTKSYPLARDLYFINCQGYEGLGIGFASFIAGERGQRIILKSGLAPVKLPSRKIVVTH